MRQRLHFHSFLLLTRWYINNGRWGDSCRFTGACTPWVTVKPDEKLRLSVLGAGFAELSQTARYGWSCCCASARANNNKEILNCFRFFFCYSVSSRRSTQCCMQLSQMWMLWLAGWGGNIRGSDRHQGEQQQICSLQYLSSWEQQ